MNKWLWRIDATSTFIGKTFAWLIVVLTLHVSWEVVARYLFNQPSSWAFDLQSMDICRLEARHGSTSCFTSHFLFLV
jgi:TRAP-type mannitol/chloroaromatic compound transport system permease small subunit